MITASVSDRAIVNQSEVTHATKVPLIVSAQDSSERYWVVIVPCIFFLGKAERTRIIRP